MNAIGRRIYGEAVEIRIGDDLTLFGLMRTQSSSYPRILERSCGMKFDRNRGSADYVRRIGAFRGKCTVDEKDHPAFVYFTDFGVPETIRYLGDHPDEFEIKTVTIETTNDQVVYDLDERHTWIKIVSPSVLDVRKIRDPGLRNIDRSHFIQRYPD